jgi:hypothetical protein
MSMAEVNSRSGVGGWEVVAWWMRWEKEMVCGVVISKGHMVNLNAPVDTASTSCWTAY